MKINEIDWKKFITYATTRENPVSEKEATKAFELITDYFRILDA